MLSLHSWTLLENKMVLSRVRASRSMLQEEGQHSQGKRLGKGLQESPGLMPLVVVSVGTHTGAPACINASNCFTSIWALFSTGAATIVTDEQTFQHVTKLQDLQIDEN